MILPKQHCQNDELQKMGNKAADFLGGPVVKTVLPVQGAQVRSLVRELDPACCNY